MLGARLSTKRVFRGVGFWCEGGYIWLGCQVDQRSQGGVSGATGC